MTYFHWPRCLGIILLSAFLLISCSLFKKRETKEITEEKKATPVQIQPEEVGVKPSPPSQVSPLPIQEARYRIQIFVSSSRENAWKIAEEARQKLSLAVYVVNAPPYFKVWIGDCFTMEEAFVLKDKAKTNGYTDAFVVEMGK
ncbi:MAG: SPOR domain-containing protein [Candidatus Edwardsbacteria bacterium]